MFTGIDEFKLAINEQATSLKTFLPISCNEVQKEILGMNNKTCKLDHIPTQVLQKILPIILGAKIPAGAIIEIVNISISTGSFAHNWKSTIVKPLLKKPGIDLVKKNHRPVSNLSFLSKSGACSNNYCSTVKITIYFQISSQHTRPATLEKPA